jgi:hypothetical protein
MVGDCAGMRSMMCGNGAADWMRHGLMRWGGKKLRFGLYTYTSLLDREVRTLSPDMFTHVTITQSLLSEYTSFTIFKMPCARLDPTLLIVFNISIAKELGESRALYEPTGNIVVSVHAAS